MHTRPRRLVVSASVVLLTLAAIACTPGGSTSAPTASGPAGSSGSVSTAPSDGPSEAPSGAAASPSEAMSQTDTEWGRIWDAVPAGFPTYRGSTPAEDAGVGPASASYAIDSGDAGEIASWMQTALETATYSTEALSGPLEDGSFTLDSVGGGDCRILTTITPMGGLQVITVQYGAACPAP